MVGFAGFADGHVDDLCCDDVAEFPVVAAFAADELAEFGEVGFAGEVLVHRFGHVEVDDLPELVLTDVRARAINGAGVAGANHGGRILHVRVVHSVMTGGHKGTVQQTAVQQTQREQAGREACCTLIYAESAGGRGKGS